MEIVTRVTIKGKTTPESAVENSKHCNTEQIHKLPPLSGTSHQQIEFGRDCRNHLMRAAVIYWRSLSGQRKLDFVNFMRRIKTSREARQWIDIRAYGLVSTFNYNNHRSGDLVFRNDPPMVRRRVKLSKQARKQNRRIKVVVEPVIQMRAGRHHRGKSVSRSSTQVSWKAKMGRLAIQQGFAS